MQACRLAGSQGVTEGEEGRLLMLERGIQLALLAKGDAACVHRHVCTSKVQAWVSLVSRGDKSFFKQFARVKLESTLN